MKTSLIVIAMLSIALGASAGETQAPSMRFPDSPVNVQNTQQQYKLLSNRLIAEYLDSGKLSRESSEAYQLMLGIANRSGIRLEKTPIRTADERNLGPALVIARLESLGLGYDRIYRLKLQNQ